MPGLMIRYLFLLQKKQCAGNAHCLTVIMFFRNSADSCSADSCSADSGSCIDCTVAL